LTLVKNCEKPTLVEKWLKIVDFGRKRVDFAPKRFTLCENYEKVVKNSEKLVKSGGQKNGANQLIFQTERIGFYHH
jgi:hypothetical protein